MAIELGSAYGKVSIDASGAQQGSKQAQQALNGLGVVTQTSKMAWTELNSAMGVYKQVAAEVAKIINETVGVYVQRADAAHELARLTGDDIETTSRLIEASDDLFVSQQTLTSGMEFAIRQGYQPSVEWLKQMADQIMAIPDPADRAKAAIDTFGRSAGPEMLKLLEQGSNGIDQYMAAIEDGMVVTEEAYQKAQNYKVAMDQWKDTFTTFKMAIADGVIEPLTTLIRIGALWRESDNEDKQHWQMYIPLYGQVREAIRGISAVMKGLKQDKLDANAVPDPTVPDPEDIEKAADAVKKLSDQYASLLGLTIDLTDENRDFQSTMQDLQGQAADLRGEISVLEGKQYLTDAQKTELEGLKTDLDEITGKIEETAKAHEDASKRIVFSLLQAKLSADGLTTTEFNMLIKTGEAMGIIDSQSADTAVAINGLTDQFIAGQGSVDNYYNRVKAILDLPSEKTFTYTTVADYYTYFHGNPGGGGGGSENDNRPIIGWDTNTNQPIYGQAKGGDWLVDEPTLFLAGDEGPERATFTPMQGGEQGSGAGTTIQVGDIIIHVGKDASPLAVGREAEKGVLRALRAVGAR